MSRTEVLQGRSFSHETSAGSRRLALRLLAPPHSLEEVLGNAAWMRLPEAVRARFADEARAVDYVGEFEIVRASLVGRLIAWACQIIGTPVVPRRGFDVPAVVHVGPSGRE